MQSESLPLLLGQESLHEPRERGRQGLDEVVDAIVLVLEGAALRERDAAGCKAKAHRPRRHRHGERQAGGREAELARREGAERNALDRLEEIQRDPREDGDLDREHLPAVLAALVADPQSEEQHQAERDEQRSADPSRTRLRGATACGDEHEQHEDLEEHPRSAGRERTGDHEREAEEGRDEGERSDPVAREAASRTRLGEARNEREQRADAEHGEARARAAAVRVDLEPEQRSAGADEDARDRRVPLGRAHGARRSFRRPGHSQPPTRSGNAATASSSKPDSASLEARSRSTARG